jgi:ankyrin repeat protein
MQAAGYLYADKPSQTALHKAALQGHLSIIIYLLPDKADVHARDADGWTALHNACSKVCSIFPIHSCATLIISAMTGLSRCCEVAL